MSRATQRSTGLVCASGLRAQAWIRRIRLALTSAVVMLVAGSPLCIQAGPAGDVAPRGMPDGILDVADLGLILQFLTGRETPDSVEQLLMDVAPYRLPDGRLDVDDYLLIQRAVHGDIRLDPVSVPDVPVIWGQDEAASPYRVGGLAAPGALVTIYVDGSLYGQVTANANGLFATSLVLVPGAVHVIAASMVAGGIESPRSGALTVSLPGPLPAVVATDLLTISQGDSLQLAGQAGSLPVGMSAVIRLTDGSEHVVAANADGSFDFSMDNAAGQRIASVVVQDMTGRRSDPSVFTVPGTTAGRFEVDPTGAANYSVPITLPPGTAGRVPGLSLDYHSRAGNGTLGRGWSLGGLSAITRCPKTPAQDGSPGGVNMDAHDRYCLDGRRLVAISGQYGGNLTEYRTEIDSFMRIISYTTSGLSPDYFRAWTRSGEIIEYGNTPDSAFNPRGGDVLLWGASRVADRLGNYFAISYYEDVTAAEHYPQRIDYTANDAAGLQAYNAVEFVYSGRPDPSASFVAGHSIASRTLLTRLRVLVDSAVIREYRLAYDSGPLSGTARLRSVQECSAPGMQATCMMPIEFEWSDGEHGFQAVASVGSYAGGDTHARVTDINGDGRHDLLLPRAGNWRIHYGGASGLSAEVNTAISTLGSYVDRVLLIDHNSDGVNELLVPRTDDSWDLLKHDGSSIILQRNFLHSRGSDAGPEVLDFDGDGRQDLLVGGGRTVYGSPIHHLYINSAAGFGNPVDTGLGVLSNYERVLDYDNDGVQDLLTPFAYYNNCSWYLLRRSGEAFSNEVVNSHAACLATASGKNVMIGDINGDGLPDLAGPRDGVDEFGVALNTGAGLQDSLAGSGLPATGDWQYARSIDYNADGRLDILLPVNGNWTIYQATGSGFIEVDTLHDAGGYQQARLMDVNGDGLQDIIAATAGAWRVSLRNGPVPDQLLAIRNGMGFTTRITYQAITDTMVHTRGNGAVFPEQDYQGPLRVVSQVAVDDGIGGTYLGIYNYAGARVHATGRGFSGFRDVTVTDPQSDTVSTTTYRQDFPFTGMAESSETRVAGVLIDATINALASVNTINNQAGVYFPHVTRTIRHSYDAPGSSNPGAPIKTVVTDSVYDSSHGAHYGNPASITVTTTAATGEVYAKATTSSYAAPDVNAWILDRVLRTSVAHTGTGQAAVTRTAGFGYYPDGLLHEEIIEPDAGTASPLYLKTSYEYDSFGNKTRVTVTGLRGHDESSGSEDRITETRYDSQGRFPLWTMNALDHREDYTHDARFGGKTSLTGPNGLTTTWAYDSLGRKVSETRADGAVTSWTHDFCSSADCQNGGFIETVSATGSAPVKTYHDALQRAVRTQTTALDGRLVHQDTAYDNRGNVISQSRPYFAGSATARVTSFGFDALNRPVREDAPDGGNIDYLYTGFYRNTRRTHDSDGYDQFDQRKTNAVDQLVQVIDAMNGTRYYGYDAAGNLRTVSDHIDPARGSVVTRTDYDLRGRKTSMDDPDMGQWAYKYNAFGELVWQQDAKGQVVTMNYDRLGRMVSRVEPEGISTWSYDQGSTGIGKLAAVSYAASGHTRTLAYDGLGRLQAETSTIDAEVLTLAYTYDGVSRRQTVTYPTGFIVRNVYNGHGQLVAVKDAANDMAYWTAMATDAEGHVTSADLGNGLQTLRSYEPANGTLKTISTGAGSNSDVQYLEYSFDALGNLRKRQDHNQGLIEHFDYDDLNRLRSAAIAGAGTRTYAYDAKGNILEKSDFGDDYTYGAGTAGPHAVTEVKNGAQVQASYSYDANGNMVSGDGRTITWASFNKAVTIQRGGTTLQFYYDADHNRVKQVNGSHQYYYLSPRIDAGTHYEKEIDGADIAHKHYILAGSRAVAIYTQNSDSRGKTRYLHTDHLGSTDVITDENGQVVERQGFSPFGSRRNSDWSSPTSVLAGIETHHGFTGHEHLDEVGIIHMNGRLYDPKLGRFLSPDIQVQYPDRTLSFNRYTYVNNNPLSFTDPSGYGFFSDLWKKIRKVVAVVAAVAVAVVGFAWGAVYFMSISGALTTAATFAGFTYGAVTGGVQGAIKGALTAYGLASTIAGIQGIARSLLSSMQSVLSGAASAARTFSNAIEHVLDWSLHQYTNLKTRQEMARFAKKNGLTLTELNLILGGISFAGSLAGYDRIRVGEDANFGGSEDQPGVRGFLNSGAKGLPLDVVDTALVFQGIPSAQGLSLAISCGGQVNGACLGADNRGTLFGHSLGAAEVAVMKGLGLINKSVGVKVFSLPFTRIAPSEVGVYQGSGDVVNFGILGYLTNIDSSLVEQGVSSVSSLINNHKCGAGYAVVGCGR